MATTATATTMATAAATTDRPGQARGAGTPRARAARPRFLATAGAALSAFLLALAFLAWQMGSGRDPALGRGQAWAPTAAPRRVLVRHIVITRVERREVIVRRRPSHIAAAPTVATAAAPAAPTAPAPAAPAPSRPTPRPTPRPAPRPAAPVPAPKPAAAQPAPPTTHQS